MSGVRYTQKMTEYVLGFYFSPDEKQVVLIKKTKPEWQAGLFNGVGGKIEELEGPWNAMVREFYEEAGLKTSADEWDLKATLGGQDWRVFVFRSTAKQDFSVHAQEGEEEVPSLVPVDQIKNVIPNLYWLIPLCLDKEPTHANVSY